MPSTYSVRSLRAICDVFCCCCDIGRHKVLCLSIYADQNTASVVAKATIIRLRPRPRPHPSRPRPGLSRPRSRPEVSDCQVYGSCSPSHVDAFLSTIHATSLISSTLSPAWCNPTECNSTTTRPSSGGGWAIVRRQHRLPITGQIGLFIV